MWAINFAESFLYATRCIVKLPEVLMTAAVPRSDISCFGELCSVFS